MNSSNINNSHWYTTQCGDCKFMIPVRYQNLKPIGTGGFGSVAKAVDTKTGGKVAIKKLLFPFETAKHAKRTYREIKLLIYLNHSDANVVQLRDVFTPETTVENFNSLYLVFNLLDCNLRVFLKSTPASPENQIQAIIYCILRGLKFIHSADVLHRDLKPANIGIDGDSKATILDFGLARVSANDLKTGYVATRWWRAPEVILNWERYDPKIDIWSVGCIMGEMILRRPLFPGGDQLDQLNRIFDLLGTPNVKAIQNLCCSDVQNYIFSLPLKSKQDLKKIFGYQYDRDSGNIISGVSEEGITFLERLLTLDPSDRPTAEEALENEPTIERLVDTLQDADLTVAEWKQTLLNLREEYERYFHRYHMVNGAAICTPVMDESTA